MGFFLPKLEFKVDRRSLVKNCIRLSSPIWQNDFEEKKKLCFIFATFYGFSKKKIVV